MVRVARRSTEPSTLRGGEQGYNAEPAHRAMHMLRTDVDNARVHIRARFAEPSWEGAYRVPDPLLCSRSGRFAAPFVAHPRSSVPPRRSLRAPVSALDSATVWHRFRGELRKAVNESTWHIWLERMGFRELDGMTLVLEAPDDVRAWAEKRFGRVLTACAERVLGP